jgi:integrase
MRGGHIRRRGKRSFELKFDVDRAEGRRQTIYRSFKGSKREAQAELARLLAQVADNAHVEPNKFSVGQYVRNRVAQWRAADTISERTAQRYCQLLEGQIGPFLGAKRLQKLGTLDIERWHTELRAGGRKDGRGGVSARTARHAHRLLSKALREAVLHGLAIKNVAALQRCPKVIDDEMMIVQNVSGLLDKLTGSRLRVPSMIALFTGMRLSEVLALRWSRINFDGKVIEVREALEQTKAHGIQFKAPKSRTGRRDITLPDILVDVLREHHKAALEFRMQLGAGRLSEDALLFADIDGKPLSPNAISAAWADFAEKIGMPEVTFHALRHTHASQLIDAGVDIVTISKRLGHAKPDITLRIYAHLFRKDDSKAAAAINAALAGQHKN